MRRKTSFQHLREKMQPLQPALNFFGKNLSLDVIFWSIWFIGAWCLKVRNLVMIGGKCTLFDVEAVNRNGNRGSH